MSRFASVVQATGASAGGGSRGRRRDRRGLRRARRLELRRQPVDLGLRLLVGPFRGGELGFGLVGARLLLGGALPRCGEIRLRLVGPRLQLGRTLFRRGEVGFRPVGAGLEVGGGLFRGGEVGLRLAGAGLRRRLGGQVLARRFETVLRRRRLLPRRGKLLAVLVGGLLGGGELALQRGQPRLGRLLLGRQRGDLGRRRRSRRAQHDGDGRRRGAADRQSERGAEPQPAAAGRRRDGRRGGDRRRDGWRRDGGRCGRRHG